MESPGHGWTDRQAEQLVGRILQIGVLISATVVLAGGLLYLSQNAQKTVGHHRFHVESQRLRNVPEIGQDAVRLDSLAVMQLGVLLLILTPVARVAFTVLVFLVQRDYTFVAVTLFVLTMLLFSLLGARFLPG